MFGHMSLMTSVTMTNCCPLVTLHTMSSVYSLGTQAQGCGVTCSHDKDMLNMTKIPVLTAWHVKISQRLASAGMCKVIN